MPVPHDTVPSMPSGSDLDNLGRLLASMFTDGELRRLFAADVNGDELAAALPGPSASLADLAHAGVRALAHRGMIGPDFFARLLAERPLRGAEIAGLAARLVHPTDAVDVPVGVRQDNPQSQTSVLPNGRPARRLEWKLVLQLASPPDCTKGQLFTGLTRSIFTYDMQNFQRRSRWPAVLFGPNSSVPTTDGSLTWRQTVQQSANRFDIEQCTLSRQGLTFQRTSLWDVDRHALDFDVLGTDAFLFLCVASQFLREIEFSGERTVALTVEANPFPIGALFSECVVPVYTGSPAQLTTPIGPLSRPLSPTDTNLEALASFCVQFLDDVANEFVLTLPSLVRESPSFLLIRPDTAIRLIHWLAPERT